MTDIMLKDVQKQTDKRGIDIQIESENPNADISMYINSPGGDVSAGEAIIDTMNYIKAPVSTIGMGLVASMASVILAAGEKGKRFALQNTQIMIHQPMAGTQGQITDMEIHVAKFKETKKLFHTKYTVGREWC